MAPLGVSLLSSQYIVVPWGWCNGRWWWLHLAGYRSRALPVGWQGLCLAAQHQAGAGSGPIRIVLGGYPGAIFTQQLRDRYMLGTLQQPWLCLLLRRQLCAVVLGLLTEPCGRTLQQRMLFTAWCLWHGASATVVTAMSLLLPSLLQQPLPACHTPRVGGSRCSGHPADSIPCLAACWLPSHRAVG